MRIHGVFFQTMQSMHDIISQILEIKQKIHTEFPELDIFIDEMRNPISFQKNNDVSNKYMQDYYNTLHTFYQNHKNEHYDEKDRTKHRDLDELFKGPTN